MKAPAVSVILPTFNRLPFLRLTIESVFEQTFDDWELIIADDGSDRQTQDYIAALARLPRVKVIQLDHSGNPSVVRNAALREARGKYVAFLDSDDTWMPTKLARQIGTLSKNERCRWIYTGYKRVDENGLFDPRPSPQPWIPYSGRIAEPLLRLKASLATAAVLADRALVVEAGAFDPELPMFEHYDLWLRLAHLSEVEVVDEPLTCLRSHSQHYSQAGIVLLRSRGLWLSKAYAGETTPQLRRLIETLKADNAVRLASLQADTDRWGALREVFAEWPGALRTAAWWRGVPRVLLKIGTPYPVLNLYRRRRQARSR